MDASLERRERPSTERCTKNVPAELECVATELNVVGLAVVHGGRLKERLDHA